MKRKIGRNTYDTETAELIRSDESAWSHDTVFPCIEKLYRTKESKWFLHSVFRGAETITALTPANTGYWLKTTLILQGQPPDLVSETLQSLGLPDPYGVPHKYDEWTMETTVCASIRAALNG